MGVPITPGQVSTLRANENRQAQILAGGVSDPAEGQGAATAGNALGTLATGIGAIAGLVQIGLAISQFVQDERAARQENRENRQAFRTSRDVLGRLLGAGFDIGAKQAVGGLSSNITTLPSDADLEANRQATLTRGFTQEQLDQLGEEGLQEFLERVEAAGTAETEFGIQPDAEEQRRRLEGQRGFRDDQVVRPGDELAKLVPAGTILATRPGDKGLNPDILAIRQRIFQLMNSPAISEGDLSRLNEITTGQVAQGLTRQPLTGNVSSDLAALASLGGAGQGVAQNALNTAVINQQFQQGGRELGLNFLNQLFGIAGSTF